MLFLDHLGQVWMSPQKICGLWWAWVWVCKLSVCSTTRMLENITTRSELPWCKLHSGKCVALVSSVTECSSVWAPYSSIVWPMIMAKTITTRVAALAAIRREGGLKERGKISFSYEKTQHRKITSCGKDYWSMSTWQSINLTRCS